MYVCMYVIMYVCMYVLMFVFFYVSMYACMCFFFFSSRRRHTRCGRDWSSDVCSSDLYVPSYNGKDLSGWKTHPDQPGGWSVEDGLLTGRSTSRNHLFSEAGDYTNFHLR